MRSQGVPSVGRSTPACHSSSTQPEVPLGLTYVETLRLTLVLTLRSTVEFRDPQRWVVGRHRDWGRDGHGWRKALLYLCLTWHQYSSRSVVPTAVRVEVSWYLFDRGPDFRGRSKVFLLTITLWFGYVLTSPSGCAHTIKTLLVAD